MNAEEALDTHANEGAYGVNYALRPHKFVDRRVFIEVLTRFSRAAPLHNYAYVGLGSFAMEDHKLIHAFFGMRPLLSLEIEPDVVRRQIFNTPLACIVPTTHSTADFVANRDAILQKQDIAVGGNLVVWFDMTDGQPLTTHISTFFSLLKTCNEGDVVRFTVDVDGKTLARTNDEDSSETLWERRFAELQEQLDTRLRRGARPKDLKKDLGIARLVLHAFSLAAEDACPEQSGLIFEPFSLTTYADGHRMLSITGAVIKRSDSKKIRELIGASNFPGGSRDWEDLVNIQIPQLTVWEKLYLDRHLGNRSSAQLAQDLGFKLHENLQTELLLEGYRSFQRFYPNFKPVVL